MADVDLADLLAAFARTGQGNGARTRSPARGQDFESEARVSLEQLHGGGDIEVRAYLPQLDEQGIPHRVLRTFRVALPVGAAHGQRLRLGGKGAPGLHGGPPGNLYVELILEPHRLFRVDGRDLHLDLPLAPWEAVLGAAVRVPTLDGPVELTIAPGTVAGRRLRLGGRGLRRADGSSGALFAVVQITVPTKVGDAERALYAQLATLSEFNPRSSFA